MVSVIIPTLNSEKYIRGCLRALVMQDYPSDQYEVIVVDNGSTDRTVQMAEEFPVTVLKNISGNISKLRNIGARSAIGDILAFIDSDCIAPLTWLSDAADILEKENIKAAGCWYALPDHPTWVQKVWDLQMSDKRKGGAVKWVPSGNFFIRKDVFEEIGGFEESLQTGEDTNICQKISDKGYKIFSVPVLAVKHSGEAETVRQFFQKQKWHGIGGVQRFVREFPRFVLDKTMIFAFVLSVSILGIFVSAFFDPSFVSGWLIAASVIPFVMTLKAMLRTKQWKLLFPLLCLYFVYGFARMLPAMDIRLWIKELKQAKG